MTLMLVLAAGLWGLGLLLGAPLRARLAMIGMLYVGVLLAQLLPADNPLRAALGGTPQAWLALGSLAASPGPMPFFCEPSNAAPNLLPLATQAPSPPPSLTATPAT